MKYLLILVTLLFIGCTSDNPSDCKRLGYKGIIVTDGFIGYDHCSNGEIVETDMFSTPDGNKWIGSYSFLPFDSNSTRMVQRR